MTLLKAENIGKSYGNGAAKTQVLTQASFNLAAGEFVTLLGPSGSGKSTLLNICGLIDRPDSGTLFNFDENLIAFSPAKLTEFRRRNIGFIFQNFNLIPVMTAAANVAYPLFLLNWAEQDITKRVEEVLAQVGLSDFAKCRPEQLSGGQNQRVAIARALVKKPSLIIADEPTASLDSDTAVTVVDLMKKLANEQGTACLVATHDERLLPFCDQILHVHHGKIVKQVISEPARFNNTERQMGASL
jgi:putative ABC transport system ATP-binding protein